MSVPLVVALTAGLPWAPVLPVVECERVVASWYGDRFAGRATASGELFDPDGLTAAHRTLPFGTVVEVRGPGGSVTVEVNDRGPFVAGRGLDLSRGAFAEVAPLDAGVVDVTTCVRSRLTTVGG